MSTEKHWQRALAAFRAYKAGAEDLEALIRSEKLNAEEARILHQLIAADSQQTEVVDDVFRHAQQHTNTELLKNREGELLGEYRLLKLIGTGGMSAVYLARRDNTDIQKAVAVKVLLFPSVASEVLTLFLQEQRLLANLNHPNIVSMLHGATTADGMPYLVMEYISGAQTIDKWVKENNPNPETIVRQMLLPLCDAVTHAHAHLIVHSDIKPGNVLVDENGTVKLLDFGISSFVSTQQGEPVQALSPAYASPEQLAGKNVTVASDIYSTGVLLGHLLTASEPDTRQDPDKRQKTLQQQLRANNIDPDLARIIGKATALKPEDRYASMQDMRQDLRRWLKSEPIMAHPGGLLYRLRKFVQRRAALSLTIGLLLASIITGFILLEQESRKYQREAETARQVTRFMLDAFAVTDPDMAQGVDFSARDILTNARRTLADQPVKDPTVNATLLAAIGTAQARLGDFTGSYATIAPLLEQSEPPSQAVSTVVESLLYTGDIEQAKAILDRHGRQLPATEHAYWQARLAYAEDRFSDTFHWLDVAEQLTASQNLQTSKLFQLRLQQLRGQTLHNQGKTEQALAIYQQTLKQARRTAGEQHSLSLGLQQRIATAYGDRAELDKAYQALKKLLTQQERHFGTDHPVLIHTLLQLAGNRQHKQQFDEASQYASRALTLARKKLGENSLLTGRAHNMAGILTYRRGDLPAAIEHLQQANAIYHRQLGSQQRETGEIDTTLATLLLAAGKPEQAEKLIGPVTRWQAEKLGEAHPATIYSRLAWLKSLNALQRHKQARNQALAFLPQAIAGVGEKHPMVMALRKALADAHAGLGEHTQAIEIYQQVLASPYIQQQINQLPALLNQLGSSQWQAGQYEKARQTFARALQAAEKAFGADSPGWRAIQSAQQRLTNNTKAGHLKASS